MLICREYLASFFEVHKEHLKHNYPGISFDILMNHFHLCTGIKPDDYMKEDSFFLEKLKNGTPLSYITNSHFFYKSEFYTDERVLIPRSETEILVEDAIHLISAKKAESLRVAEVGVGSFALGLSLLAECSNKIHFWGGDISEEAIKVAEINLFRLRNKLNPEHNINLVLSDRLKQAPENLDLIISNPPYIKRSQVSGVHHQVQEFEPDIALFLDDDDFDHWFSSFFKEAHYKLAKGGAFMMEGHEDNLEELSLKAEKIFTRCLIKKDYTNRDRFLYCYKD